MNVAILPDEWNTKNPARRISKTAVRINIEDTFVILHLSDEIDTLDGVVVISYTKRDAGPLFAVDTINSILFVVLES